MADQPRLLRPDEFNKFFTMVLKDEGFRQELMVDGFGALERRGLKDAAPPEVRSAIAQAVGQQVIAAKPRCGFCGICGLCTLCGEINAGSGSAALWASFFLAV